MKILRLICTLDPATGGPTEAARQIDSLLMQMGHQVEVVCLDEPGADFHKSYPAPVTALGPSRLGYRYNSSLVPFLRENHDRFDAVIVNGLWQYPGFAAWRVLSGTDTPYFVFTHGMLDPWFKRQYPLKHLKKWMYWPWAEYRVLRDARAVLFTTEEERLQSRQSFWLYKCNEVVTAYGTSSPPPDEGLSEGFLGSWPGLGGKRIMLFLSRIHQKKGCDLLIDAFAQVASRDPVLQLVMAGPDPDGMIPALKARAEALGIAERITWTGMLKGNLKWGAFYAAEVFCLPSHQENFGIAVAEALACGRAVLVSDKVNIWREVLADGAAIVQPDTLEGTSRMLEQWLDKPIADRDAMSKAAAICFMSRFHIDHVANTLITILDHGSRHDLNEA
jgi:glycosyltransferase involved in cell wall biosynthesis